MAAGATNGKNALTTRSAQVEMTKLKIFLDGNLKQSRSEKLIVVDDANRQICTVRVKILDDGRIGWWTLLRNFRRSLDNSSPMDGVYVYRMYPVKMLRKGMVLDILNSCIKRGEAELYALRYKLSLPERVFRSFLVKYGLNFKLKKHVSDCLIDFWIRGSKDDVFLKIINNDDITKELLEEVRKLTDEGRIIYLLLEDDVLKRSDELVKKIAGVVDGNIIYPNGLMTSELRLDKANPPIKIFVKRYTITNPAVSRKARFMKLFRMDDSGLKRIAETSMPRNVWSFAKKLSNILAKNGLFHSVSTSRYEKILERLREDGITWFYAFRILEKPLERGES